MKTLIAALKSVANNQRDLLDAVDHISPHNRKFDLKDFEKHDLGMITVENLDYVDDLSSWSEYQPGELVDLTEEELTEELTSFRDHEFAKNALGWITSGKFPPIVVIAYPLRDDGTDITLGDGRGRVNVARALNIPKLPALYLKHKSITEYDLSLEDLKDNLN